MLALTGSILLSNTTTLIANDANHLRECEADIGFWNFTLLTDDENKSKACGDEAIDQKNQMLDLEYREGKVSDDVYRQHMKNLTDRAAIMQKSNSESSVTELQKTEQGHKSSQGKAGRPQNINTVDGFITRTIE